MASDVASDVDPIRFVVYSDYLCPWCLNASVRLRALEREYAGQVEFEWRAYLLRPQRREWDGPEARERALQKFRHYTKSWLRPAADPDGGEFQVWQSDEGPPSHSIPGHVLARLPHFSAATHFATCTIA